MWDVNDSHEFFLNFQEWQSITKKALDYLYWAYQLKEDLHIERYWNSQLKDHDCTEPWEEFIAVWKDTWNSSVEYKWPFKVSFVLEKIIDTIWEPIEIYKCIYLI